MLRLLSLGLLLTSAAAAPVTLVAGYRDAAEVLQWTESGGQLTGTWQAVYQSGHPPVTKAITEPFTGTRVGDTITLKFTSTLLASTSTRVWTGTLSGSVLTLNRPLSTGGFATVIFKKSSVDAFNAAVARVTQDVQQQRDAAAATQRAQAAQQAQVDQQTQAAQQVNTSAETLFRQARDVTNDLADDGRDLQAAAAAYQQDLAALLRDQEALLSDAQKARDCYDVQSVQGYDLGILTGYDLSQLTGYDANLLQRAVQNQERHLKTVQDLRSQLDTTAQDFFQLQGKLPLSRVAFSVTGAQFGQSRMQLQQAQQAAAVDRQAAQAQITQAMQKANALIADAKRAAAALTCQP